MAVTEDSHARYRCHTGHAYSAESLLAAVSEGIDRALGVAERVLQEGELLLRQYAEACDPGFERQRVAHLRDQADHLSRQAQVIRTLLAERLPVPAGRDA